MPIENGKDANVLRSVGQRIPVPHLPGGRRTATLTPPETGIADPTVIGPTKEEAERGFAPGKFRRFVESLARRWARPVSIGTAVGIGATVGYAVYDNVSTEAATWWESVTKNALAGSENIAFKPDASSGSIGENNTFPVALETAETVLSNYKKLNLADETTLLFPLGLPEGTRGVKYAFQEDFKEFDPKIGKTILTENKNWVSYSKVPTGTKIYAPVDGAVVSHITRDGSTTGLSIMFIIEGIEYTLKIAGTTPDPIFKLATTDIPSIPEYARGAQKAVVKRGVLLMTLTKDNSDIQLHLTSTPLGSSENKETPVPIKFITATDNTGTEKLLALSQ